MTKKKQPHAEMNPSMKRQNELNPNVPEEFTTLTQTDIAFAKAIYIEKQDPTKIYKKLGLHIHSADKLCMGKYECKKGEEKTPKQIQLGITRMLSKIKDYGNYLKEQEKLEYEQSDAYSRDIAIETCLKNIQVARATVETNHKLVQSLDTEDAGYTGKAMRLNAMISQGQKTILSFIKELNKLQHLYNKGDSVDDKVTLVFDNTVDR